MVRFDGEYEKEKKATKWKPVGNQKTTNSFKRNVPKKLQQEWGERMRFLRSI